MKKKIFYLSSTDLAQVDMGFLHYLTDSFELYYHVIIPEKRGNYSKSELEEYAGRYNINFKAYHFKRRKRDFRIGIEFYSILKEIKKINPDIIYTISHDIPIISLMSMTLDKNKTIIPLHDVKFHSNIPFAFFFKIGRMITMRYFKYFQVLSKNQENIFKQWYPEKTVYTIPLTLSDFGKADTTNMSIGKPSTRFLFFGYIESYKGLDILLKAVNSLSRKYSGFELTIAGRCDVWDEVYEPLIEDKTIINKRIGFIRNEEIPELFQNSHYLILPYKDATQSGPLMIAYNYNIPVIASNVDAFTTAIEEGKSGYLFDVKHQKSLEEVLEAAILRTDEEYDALLQNLKAYVKHNYSTENIVEKYKKMFTEIMNKKSVH